MRTNLSRWTCRLAVVALAPFSSAVARAAPASPSQPALHTVIYVDADAAPGGDGSERDPYDNLTDALADAETISGAVVIEVAPGDYVIDSSLVIDRSSLELRGSSVLIKDNHGWPTGAVAPGTSTRLLGSELLGPEPLVAVSRADGVVVEEVGIRGFVFVPAEGGIGVWLTRVQGYSVRGNVFGAPAFLGLESTASSGRVESNHFSGVASGAILEGGYADSPSVVSFRGNRSVQNFTGGVLLAASSFGVEEGDELEADVRDNDLSNNAGAGGSFGFRVFLFGPDTPLSVAHVHALLQGNRLVGNSIGIVIDAGFPYRGADRACDERVFSGSIDLRLKDNTLRNSLVTPALVTLTRRDAALDPETLSEWQYLHRAAFTLSDSQQTLAGAWIDHPARDPFVGTCPGDAAHEALENRLRYNGVVLPNGRNF